MAPCADWSSRGLGEYAAGSSALFSSGWRRQLFGDSEAGGCHKLYAVNALKALVKRRTLESLLSAKQSCGRYGGIAESRSIALECRLGIGIEEVTDDAKSRRERRRYVTSSLPPCGIGIIDDKRLLGIEAGVKQQLLSSTGAQQVQADPYMRIEESLAEERSLSRRLNAAEDDRFHRSRVRSPGDYCLYSSLSIPLFSSLSRKRRSTNCSGLAVFAAGTVRARSSRAFCMPAMLT
jgi:hypothetical protein